jgi:RNA polymerase sigma factor (TIGR02999 family)
VPDTPAPEPLESVTTPGAGPGAGPVASFDARFAEHYVELRRLAHMRLHRDGGGFALDTTSLVNECYLKLRNIGSLAEAERAHFLAYASRTMRSVIIDLVREELAMRRGGDVSMVTLNTAIADSVANEADGDGKYDVMAINDALTKLEQTDARLAQVVELRYFGGMTFPEMSELMGLTERTVRRDWDKAKLLLMMMLKDAP